METVDVLIVVFAVVAVTGSIAGAALYEPATGGIEFDVDFSESRPETGERISEGRSFTALNADQTEEFTFEHNVTPAAITNLEFNVIVESGRGAALPRAANPSFQVTLTPPGADAALTDSAAACRSTLSGSANSASCTATVPDRFVVAVPEDTTVTATNETAASAAMNETLRSNATGIWTVTVTVTYPSGSAPSAEQVTVSSTPTYQFVRFDLSRPGLDLSPAA